MDSKGVAQDRLEWLLQHGSYVYQMEKILGNRVVTLVKQVGGNHVWQWWWDVEFYIEAVTSRVDENFIGGVEVNEISPYMFHAQVAWDFTMQRNCESWKQLNNFYKDMGQAALDTGALDHAGVNFDNWLNYCEQVRKHWAYVHSVLVSDTYQGKGVAKTIYKLLVDWLDLRAAHGLYRKRLRQSFVQLDDGIALWAGNWKRHGLEKRVFRVDCPDGLAQVHKKPYFNYLVRRE